MFHYQQLNEFRHLIMNDHTHLLDELLQEYILSLGADAIKFSFKKCKISEIQRFV